MKNLFLLLLLFSLSFTLKAQKIRLFNTNFHAPTSDTTSRNFRFYYMETNPVTVKDFRGDTLQMIASVNGADTPDEVDALLEYYKSGRFTHYRNPAFHNQKVQLIQFRKNGKPLHKITAEDHKVKFEQVWTEEGKEVLVNGSGINTYIDERNGEQIREIYLDSELAERYGIRPEEKDTIYYHYDKAPRPRNGMPAFYKTLARQLEYPAQAKRAQKDGRVYIRIIIDKKGELVEFIPLTENGYQLESGVVRILKRLPPWYPAVFMGEPVMSSVVLPVDFRK